MKWKWSLAWTALAVLTIVALAPPGFALINDQDAIGAIDTNAATAEASLAAAVAQPALIEGQVVQALLTETAEYVAWPAQDGQVMAVAATPRTGEQSETADTSAGTRTMASAIAGTFTPTKIRGATSGHQFEAKADRLVLRA